MCWSCTASPPRALSPPPASPQHVDDRSMSEDTDTSEGPWDPVHNCIADLVAAAQAAGEQDIVDLTGTLSTLVHDAINRVGDESETAAARASFDHDEAQYTIERLREQAKEDERVNMDLRRAIHECEIDEEGALQDLEGQRKRMDEAMELAGAGPGTIIAELMLAKDEIKGMECEISNMKDEAETVADAHAEELKNRDYDIAVLQRSVSRLERLKNGKTTSYSSRYNRYMARSPSPDYGLQRKLKELDDEVFRLTNENRRLQVRLKRATSVHEEAISPMLRTTGKEDGVHESSDGDTDMVDGEVGAAPSPAGTAVHGNITIDRDSNATLAPNTSASDISMSLPMRSLKRGSPNDSGGDDAERGRVYGVKRMKVEEHEA